jgi:hypothetical protein
VQQSAIVDKGTRKTKAPVEETSSCPSRNSESTDEIETLGQTYLVDNTQLGAKSRGLAYRRTKRLEDRAGTTLAGWGGVVKGLDQGDGWLKLGNDRYLPIVVNGIRVLTLQDSRDGEAASNLAVTAPASAESTTPMPVAASVPNQCASEQLEQQVFDKVPDDHVPSATSSDGTVAVSASSGLDDESARLAKAQPKLRPGKLVPLRDRAQLSASGASIRELH